MNNEILVKFEGIPKEGTPLDEYYTELGKLRMEEIYLTIKLMDSVVENNCVKPEFRKQFDEFQRDVKRSFDQLNRPATSIKGESLFSALEIDLGYIRSRLFLYVDWEKFE